MLMICLLISDEICMFVLIGWCGVVVVLGQIFDDLEVVCYVFVYELVYL